MADYNIYRVVELIGNASIPMYVGMTDRDFEARWAEHKLSCDGVYKNNCKGGRKGEVKNPETSHGRRADGALFHHIRDNLGGIDALGTRWDFQQIANADKQTEDDWIDLYRSMGHTLYNLQQGVGHTIPQRCAAGVDLTGCKTIEDVAARRSEYETERKRKSDERKRLAAERKSKRQEADGDTKRRHYKMFVCLETTNNRRANCI